MMGDSEYWERDEFPTLSSFLKGTCCPTKVLGLFIYLDGRVHTRQETMKAFGRIGRLISEDYTGELECAMSFTLLHALTGKWGLVEGHSVSVHMILRFLPLSERVEGSPLRDDITNFFPKSVFFRVHIHMGQCIVSAAAGVYAANTL